MTNPSHDHVPDEQYDWEAVRDRLRQEADQGVPPSWQPDQPDDELLGVVVGVQPAVQTRGYGPSPVVEIEDPTGTRWSLWLLHQVLRNEFIKQRVELGETVLIRYLGKVQPDGGGNSYDNYRLVVNRPHRTDQPDWTAIAQRYGADPPPPPPAAEPPPLSREAEQMYGDADDIPF